MGFGSSLKKLRTEANISAQKLADLIGVSPQRLRKWEDLDYDPRDQDMAKIEQFFGMELNEIQRLSSIKKFLNVPNKGESMAPGTRIENGVISLPVASYINQLQRDKDVLSENITSNLATIQASQQALMMTMAENHKVLLTVLNIVSSDTQEIRQSLLEGRMIATGKKVDPVMTQTARGKKSA